MSADAMRECLAEHEEDFKNEMGWLERVVTDRGNDSLYLPNKFHELYWNGVCICEVLFETQLYI
jgi:hypothetical protein